MMKTLGAFALAMLLPTAAWANSDTDPNVRLDLVLGGGSGDNSSFSFSPLLHAFLPIGGFAMSLDWGVANIKYGEKSILNDENKFNLLNPTIAAHTVLELGPANLRVGLGAAIPVAKSDWKNRLAYAQLAGAVGRWNQWMYAPKQATVLLPARLEVAMTDSFYIAAEAAAFAMIATSDTAVTDYGAQVAAEAMVPLGLIDVGARLQGVYTANKNDSLFQTAAGPLLKFGLGPAFLEALLLMNLDEPYGFSFSDGKTWGVRVGGGLNF